MVRVSALGLVFNLLEGLLSNIALDLPGSEGMSLGEHIFDFLKRPTSGFWETEEHMDERGKVEGSEDKVGLPCDVGEARWDGPSQGEVEHPGKELRHDVGSGKWRDLPICGSG